MERGGDVREGQVRSGKAEKDGTAEETDEVYREYTELNSGDLSLGERRHDWLTANKLPALILTQNSLCSSEQTHRLGQAIPKFLRRPDFLLMLFFKLISI